MSLLVFHRRIVVGKLRAIVRASSKLSSAEDSSSNIKRSTSEAQTVIDEDTIRHLERLSLVDFANKRGIVRLEEAIQFADKLNSVDTTGVEPLVSVLETEKLFLREDSVTEENDVEVVLSNASVTEEDYFVAPPGNIPLVGRDPNALK